MRSAAVMWRDRVAHGLSQAFQKRGLRGSALTDNGSAMTAAEIVEDLNRLWPRRSGGEHQGGVRPDSKAAMHTRLPVRVKGGHAHPVTGESGVTPNPDVPG